MADTKILNDYDAETVCDIVIEMTNCQHTDLHNDNCAYTLDEDGAYGWQWLNDEQLAEVKAKLAE